MKRLAAVGLLFGSLLCCTVAAQTDSVVHVNQFPGLTVGDKVSNAMQHCPARPVNCYLIVDASLAAAAEGTIPSLPSGAYLVDFRNSWLGVSGQSAGMSLASLGAMPVTSPFSISQIIPVTTTIGAAMAQCTNNTATSQCLVLIPAGTYNEQLVMQDWVILRGDSPRTTIIESSSGTQDTIWCNGAHFTIEDLSVYHTSNIGQTQEYPIHCDAPDIGSTPATYIFSNIVAESFGTNAKAAIGSGLRSGQEIFAYNSTFIGADPSTNTSNDSYGFYVHDNSAATGLPNLPARVVLANVKAIGYYGLNVESTGAAQPAQLYGSGSLFTSTYGQSDVDINNQAGGNGEWWVFFSPNVKYSTITAITPTQLFTNFIGSPPPPPHALEQLQGNTNFFTQPQQEMAPVSTSTSGPQSTPPSWELLANYWDPTQAAGAGGNCSTVVYWKNIVSGTSPNIISSLTPLITDSCGHSTSLDQVDFTQFFQLFVNNETNNGILNVLDEIQARYKNPATSGANQNSAEIAYTGSYWDGAAPELDTYFWQNIVGPGTSPSTVLRLFHQGSPGATEVDFGNAGSVALPAGTTIGGTLTAGLVSLTAGAGTSPTGLSISGTDADFLISFTTGSSPQTSSGIFTVTFTASRGHIAYCQAYPANAATAALAVGQRPWAFSFSATSMSLASNTTALAASTAYSWTVSCP